MKIVLIGPPSCGKGTQAELLVKKYNIKHISPGALFRQEIATGSELGKKFDEYLSEGQLVPNELAWAVVKKSLGNDGFVLDGFPRDIDQAELLDNYAHIDLVVYVNVKEDTIIKRMSGRRLCKCGEIYNNNTKPPKMLDVCDKCRSRLMQRDDDKEETVKKRIVSFHRDTEPLIAMYRDKGILFEVDGEQSIEAIFKLIVDRLGKTGQNI